jgi:hypothetical protein
MYEFSSQLYFYRMWTRYSLSKNVCIKILNGRVKTPLLQIHTGLIIIDSGSKKTTDPTKHFLGA